MKTLSLEVKRIRGVSCEVVAYFMKKSGGAPELHKSFGPHKALLTQLKKAGELSGHVFVRFKGRLGGKHVLFINVGEAAKGLDALRISERMRRLGAVVTQRLAAERVGTAVVHFDSFLVAEKEPSEDLQTQAEAMTEGLLLGGYKFKKYFTKKDSDAFPSAISLTAKDDKQMAALKKGFESGRVLAAATVVARDLGNEPSNELYPETFAKEAAALAKEHGIKCTIFDEKKIRKERMELLWAVGKGSAFPPRFIVLEYTPPKVERHLALVGKGMTFDSGGISIKPSGKMEDMKHDMCGAAAVLGATLAIAKLKLPVKVTCAIAMAENMPSGAAMNPGNIVKGRGGKTVEIANTDAEGRLILADALDWVQDLKPDYIIDAATLTGAVGVALGKICAGLMGNDDDLNLTICEASDLSGERVWELPIYSEYAEGMKSAYADMRNMGEAGQAGTIVGGMFLKNFIRDNVKWAHIDLASVAYDHGATSYSPRKGASGWGVRLLVDVARLMASSRLGE